MTNCPKCRRDVEVLTKDHIIPKWFANRLSTLGIKMPRFAYAKKRMICALCNHLKGGALEWNDPYTREYVALLIQVLGDKLRETEKEALAYMEQTMVK